MSDSISDIDTETLFALETEVGRTRDALDSARETAKDAKTSYDDARSNLERFVHGLREQHPLFDREDDADDRPATLKRA